MLKIITIISILLLSTSSVKVKGNCCSGTSRDMPVMTLQSETDQTYKLSESDLKTAIESAYNDLRWGIDLELLLKGDPLIQSILNENNISFENKHTLFLALCYKAVNLIFTSHPSRRLARQYIRYIIIRAYQSYINSVDAYNNAINELVKLITTIEESLKQFSSINLNPTVIQPPLTVISPLNGNKIYLTQQSDVNQYITQAVSLKLELERNPLIKNILYEKNITFNDDFKLRFALEEIFSDLMNKSLDSIEYGQVYDDLCNLSSNSIGHNIACINELVKLITTNNEN